MKKTMLKMMKVVMTENRGKDKIVKFCHYVCRYDEASVRIECFYEKKGYRNVEETLEGLQAKRIGLAKQVCRSFCALNSLYKDMTGNYILDKVIDFKNEKEVLGLVNQLSDAIGDFVSEVNSK